MQICNWLIIIKIDFLYAMTTYAYTIELTDHTFMALRNLLREECEKLKANHNITAYNAETGETKHPYGEILKTMSESVSGARLNSYYKPASPTE